MKKSLLTLATLSLFVFSKAHASAAPHIADDGSYATITFSDGTDKQNPLGIDAYILWNAMNVAEVEGLDGMLSKNIVSEDKSFNLHCRLNGEKDHVICMFYIKKTDATHFEAEFTELSEITKMVIKYVPQNAVQVTSLTHQFVNQSLKFKSNDGSMDFEVTPGSVKLDLDWARRCEAGICIED